MLLNLPAPSTKGKLFSSDSLLTGSPLTGKTKNSCRKQGEGGRFWDRRCRKVQLEKLDGVLSPLNTHKIFALCQLKA